MMAQRLPLARAPALWGWTPRLGLRTLHSSSVRLDASAALKRACESKCRGAKMAKACQDFVTEHSALTARERDAFWIHLALTEEEEQLDVLSKALPRGGRIAPALLDEFRPVWPRRSVEFIPTLVSALGAADGLRHGVELRASVRLAIAAAGAQTPAGLALTRLDKQLKELLRLWFNPGMLQVRAITPDSPAHVRDEAAAALRAASTLAPLSFDDPTHHRCFALSHPQMKPSDEQGEGAAPPFVVACAALLDKRPESVQDLASPPTETPKFACLLAFADTGALPREGTEGLGLDDVLRWEAISRMRHEFPGIEISALVPLPGFVSELSSVNVWALQQARGLPPHLAEALRRAVQGRPSVETTEITFTDADGDHVKFRMSDAGSLEVCIGDEETRQVLRIRVAEDGSSIRFLAEPGPVALQVNAPAEAVESGDVIRIVQLAEACRVLPVELRETLLRLAYEFLTIKKGLYVINQGAHFHFLGGATLQELLFRADESAAGLADALGVMASFVYEGEVVEEANALAYVDAGRVTAAAK